MNISIEIDCSPEEAREFFGLPDVKPMQEAVLEQIGEVMRQRVAAMDSQAIMEMWMPAGLKGWEEMRKAFWGGAARAGGDEDLVS